jgi:hypothetical protein
LGATGQAQVASPASADQSPLPLLDAFLHLVETERLNRHFSTHTDEEDLIVADLKRTVAVHKLQTKMMPGANGRIFDEAFRKHARTELQKAGYRPPVDGDSLYAIRGFVQTFSHNNQKLTLHVWCTAEEGGNMRPKWGTKKNRHTEPGIKTPADVKWILGELASQFAANTVKGFKAHFK